MALTRNSDDAAEVCQEAFLRAYSCLPKLDALPEFYPWLYRIIRNLAFNLLRRRKTATQYTAAQSLAPERAAPSAQSEVGREAERKAVWASLDALAPKFREILVLKYIEELDYASIATLLGIPKGTVMSRLYHARRAFHDLHLTLSEHRVDTHE